MKNKFFTNNKTADDAVTPSNMELLKKSITKFCMDIAEYEDEAEAALCKVHWDEEVDPIMYWRFCPVCTFEAGGSHELAHRLRHNRLLARTHFCLKARAVNIPLF